MNTAACVWKGAAAGAAGGVAGAWVMGYVFHLMNQYFRPSGGQHPRQEPQEEDSTVKVATGISERLLHRRLSGEQKQRAGTAVHYAFGALMGALYGAAAEGEPRVRAGHGALFGSAVWLGADETVVPALRLSRPPWRRTLAHHAVELASHIVYGVTAETVRGALRQRGAGVVHAKHPGTIRDRTTAR